MAWRIHMINESLWVRWVHGVYTKGDNLEIFNAPITASWVMKKICSTKDTLRNWIFHDSYSIKVVYHETFKSTPKVKWRFVVWNRMSIPRHLFCCWLMALDKLKTKDKLQALDVTTDDLCPMCNMSAKETVYHLYFDCPFSQKCLDGIEAWLGFRFKHIDKMDFRKLKLKKLHQQFMCFIYTCTIYAIWRSWNVAVWENMAPTPGYMVLQIQSEIVHRLKAIHSFVADLLGFCIASFFSSVFFASPYYYAHEVWGVATLPKRWASFPY
ncbi:uncharacterized protein LOC130818666 [Amaranthus tricolor]|uniref:uncharacterized protein LOC130818666 n=1 Tax=Amaranthus tricolor TaxID=29722 RepID=UPI00258F19EB|nr:uncharacterized protein LOC130818666 [Amaranthus tricolor]